ncbi:uncharacterized protein LOC114331896 isoform X3 [Diabrotica virgifera virgifera]|uniref:Uncharacterized protein LOC114331896 isoform X3 n=1 Tax=Diabrotica virgifera virgifera TaxID=50390 RepID=A0A6P7FRH3_DIAVI|nr:uncharacterized protein LOC114331896 isoform X3 [Diabrotica virgifera virgifera]
MNRSRNHRGRRDASQSRGDETISNFSKSRSSSTENKNTGHESLFKGESPHRGRQTLRHPFRNRIPGRYFVRRRSHSRSNDETGVYTLSHIKTESENSSEQESLSSETADLRGQTSSIISISRNWGPRGLRGERRGGYRRTNKKSDNPESGQTQNTWENSTSIKLASSKHEGGLGQQLELLKKETDLASLESCEKQSESSRKPKLIKNELSSARSEKSKEFTSLDPTEKPRALNNLDLSLTSLSEKQLINLGTSLKEFLNTQPARTKDSGERQRESSSTKVTQNIVKINTSIKKEIIKPNIDGDLVVSSTKKIASSMKTIPSSDKIISKKILDEAIIFFKEKHGPVNDATDLKVQPTGYNMVYAIGNMVLPKRFLNSQTCGATHWRHYGITKTISKQANMW